MSHPDGSTACQECARNPQDNSSSSNRRTGAHQVRIECTGSSVGTARTMAILTYRIVVPQAQEAEVSLALGASHCVAATIAHDVLVAARALLALLLNRLETRRILLLGMRILHPLLVLLARLALVERTIAVETGFCAAFVANTDVLIVLLLLPLPRLHTPWFRLPAGGWERRLVHLSSSAARR